MGLRSMFKMPKAPKPQAMPAQQQAAPTPTIDQAAQLAEEQDRMKRRRGRQSYMLSPRGQSAGSPNVGTKQLVGQ